MTVWELICELSRYEPTDEVTVLVEGEDAIDVYDVLEIRATGTPIIAVRQIYE